MNYYDLFNIEMSAPPEKIKSRYWQLSRVVHPNSNTLQSDAGLFTLYNQAYKTLIDPIQRQKYNEQQGIAIKPRKLKPGYDLHQKLFVPAPLAEQGIESTLTFIRYEPCRRCFTDGCDYCQQQGLYPTEVTVKVKVPAHTKGPITIFIEGEGACSEPGGTRGHLLVYVIPKADPVPLKETSKSRKKK